MKANKVLAMTLAMAMTAGMLAGCGSSEKEVKETKKVEDSASEGEQITLNYWTWFPSKDQIQETVDAFEKENPDIKINMTVMESKAFQEKVPLALSTEEDIDVIGVQPSAFAEEVQDYLANLDELMPEAAGEDWKDAYSEKCLEQGNQLTGGDTKMLVLTNSGSMVGFYNAALLKEIGAEVPKTFEEYKAVAEAFKEKYPDKYVSVFAGKDSWVVDEMMLTVLGQQGDYYNKWRYDGEPVDSEEFKEAINGLKKYFDEGIFSADVLDLDYASATEEFTNGDALVYYMGSWEAPLLSKTLRDKNGIELENVGAMALPTAEDDGQLTVRSYIDSGIGVVDYSEKKEAAAKFVAYMTLGDGADIFGKQLTGTSAKKDFAVDESLFDLIKLVKERSKLLPGYQIGKTGMIQEWIKDFEKSDVGHRHFSPVFGFHPGHSIKKTDTELVQACQNFIEEKAENFKQQIGWSCAWLINLWARLGDGTKANHYYEELLRQSVYDNLFDLHPPLGETEGEREVFQIDGNFGSASGVAEMLISSEKGKITILPALPDSWKNGKVRGLLASGAIEVDITWKDRKPVSVSLCSSSDQNVSLFYRNRKLAEQIELKKQEQQIINLCSC